MTSVISSWFTLPVNVVQRPRVLQTASPVLPSLLRYNPVTPFVSMAFTVVGRPLASVYVTASVEGCSSSRRTRKPNMLSFESLNTTGLSRAVSVEIRSTARSPGPA